jgi:hypothetical protein
VPLLQEGKATVAAETVPLLGLAQANAELASICNAVGR